MYIFLHTAFSFFCPNVLFHTFKKSWDVSASFRPKQDSKPKTNVPTSLLNTLDEREVKGNSEIVSTHGRSGQCTGATKCCGFHQFPLGLRKVDSRSSHWPERHPGWACGLPCSVAPWRAMPPQLAGRTHCTRVSRSHCPTRLLKTELAVNRNSTYMVLYGHKTLCFLRAFSTENNTGKIYIYILKGRI